MPWSKFWLSTLTLFLIGLGSNEFILRYANHQPSLVSDVDLFCMTYVKVSSLSNSDYVLLGASRMQTNIDLSVFEQQFPERKILQLAQSGMGTAYPVLQDIVENTTFRGTILIDETEETLITPPDQQAQKLSIDHCRHNFSLNQAANRQLAAWLQSWFVFLNPQSSSFRLWGNLLAQGELPEPFYSETQSDRSQLLDYQRAKPEVLQRLYNSRIEWARQAHTQQRMPPDKWLAETKAWQPLVRQFQEQGGKLIYIRMPVAPERWQYEGLRYPTALYWGRFIEQLGVFSVDIAEDPQFQQFHYLDTSHVDMHDRTSFTNLLLNKLQVYLASVNR